MPRHNWTEIAPELSDDDDGEVWEWCIRCGALKLGSEIFYSGKDQKKVIESSKESECKSAS
jgi:hypothetical protein